MLREARESAERPGLFHRLWLWLHPLCSRCYQLHIKEDRDIQQGDYWQCAAGVHGYDRGTEAQEITRQEISKWMWHGHQGWRWLRRGGHHD